MKSYPNCQAAWKLPSGPSVPGLAGRPFYGVQRMAWKDAPIVAATSTQASRMARLEAVLFLAREPLSSRKLSLYANLADGTEARTLVARLNQQYDQAGRAFRIEQVASGFQLVTRPKFADWLRRLSHIPSGYSLSAPAMETLAVVAYRQPVTRAEVESIRGVSCGEILGQLLDRDLIRIAGRSEQLGRPYLYQTTKRFMQLFGLRSLDELPRSEAWQFPHGGQAGEGDPMRGALSATVPSHVQDSKGQEESTVNVSTPSLSNFPSSDADLEAAEHELLRMQEEEEELEDEEEEEEDEDFEYEDEDEEEFDEEDEEEFDEEDDDEDELEEGEPEEGDDELDGEWEEVGDEDEDEEFEDEEEDDDEDWEDEEEEDWEDEDWD